MLLMRSPKFLALNSANGQPLAGGRLYTYAAGTVTPATTYSDSAGATPNANPIILDARGEALVYLNPSTAYKFLLQDSLGATVYTVDNVWEIGPKFLGYFGAAPTDDGYGSPIAVGMMYEDSTRGMLRVCTAVALGPPQVNTWSDAVATNVGGAFPGLLKLDANAQVPQAQSTFDPLGTARLLGTLAAPSVVTLEAFHRIPLKIGGIWQNRYLPSAVTLAALANVAANQSKLFYVFAYDNAGTTALEVLDQGIAGNVRVLDGASGVWVKATTAGGTDTSRTLVGMVYTSSTAAFQQSQTYLGVRSWFGRERTMREVHQSNVAADTNAANPAAWKTHANVSMSVLTWLEEHALVSIHGVITDNTGISVVQTQILVGGAGYGATCAATVSAAGYSEAFVVEEEDSPGTDALVVLGLQFYNGAAAHSVVCFNVSGFADLIG